MTRVKLCVVVGAALALAACGHDENRHSAAYQAGRAAHEATREAGKAARVMGRELEHGAVKAHEGWQDQARRDRERDLEKERNR